RTPAPISSSPASRLRTRRSTTSSTEPNSADTRRKSAAAIRKRRSAIAGSRRFRCATGRMRYWSTGSASRSSTRQGQMLDGVGDQPSRLERQCRRDRRLRSRALEDRERELQRSEKSRLRTRAQFRPRPEVSRDDAGGPQSARLRLAYRARPARTALASRSRSGGQANQLLRPHPHAERLRPLPLLAGLPTIPRHFLHTARPHKGQRQHVNADKRPTFRTADKAAI